MPYSSHQAVRRPNDRIAMSFYFADQWKKVKTFCDSCAVCQLRARSRRSDLLPIRPIPREEETFGHLQGDLIGPIGQGQYRFALVLTDIQTRYVTAFALTAPTAKNVLDKIILHSSYFGLPRYCSFDNGSQLASDLTRLCLERLGVSPRFHCPYNPRSAGVVERSNQSVKGILSRIASDHPNSWHRLLPYVLWSLRTSVNETLGVSPYQAVFGKVAVGPLQLLCDDWTGRRPLPFDIAKQPYEYLKQLEKDLEAVKAYTDEHAEREQERYTVAYNLRSRSKSFEVGQRVIYLRPASTHKLTRTWQGPGVVIEKKSPCSYIIEIDGKRQWSHANNLRKYNERVETATSHNCALIFDGDYDFGKIMTLQQLDCNADEPPEYNRIVYDECDNSTGSDVTEWSSVNTPVLDPSATLHAKTAEVKLPSQMLDPAKLAHLTEGQRNELLGILDEFSDCFRESPGFCPYVEHEIKVDADFKPKRLREYRIPELLKPEVHRQV
ncbi:MAG TPA: transposase family protein, partial [Methylomicrobium sp.]|nr:transposase family protein [Methylomicrobium sp.]